MSTALAQIIFTPTSGIAADASITTLHALKVAGGPFLDADAENFANAIETFLDMPSPPTRAMGAYISPVISRTADACRIKIIDLGDPQPRVPRVERTFTLAASGSTSALPEEVAVCLSYKGAAGSGLNPAARRGRMFWGPLSASAGTPLATPPTRPDLTAIAVDYFAAAAAMATELDTDGLRWVVYSPTYEVSTEVAELWVDNAWDTQRRRGLDATTRATSSL